jgi:raffinose/stachyose/melibiose transport system substrate-binding protein
MDEYWIVLEALKQAGVDPMLIGGSDTWPYRFFGHTNWSSIAGAAVATTGLEDVYEANYRGSISDIWSGHAQFVDRMVRQGYLVQASLTTSWPQSSQIFADGRVGMFPQGAWMTGLPEIVGADPNKFELGVFAMPNVAPDGKRYVLASMDRFVAVSSQSNHPEEAMLLYNFITRKENLEGYLEVQGLTTLLDLEYVLPAQLIEYKNIVTGPGYVTVPNIFPTPGGWVGQEAQLAKNIQAGASVNDALAELQRFYDDGKATIKF